MTIRTILPILSILMTAAAGAAATNYRDYDEKSVPKPADRRRVGVAVNMDRDAVERGSYETKLLQGLLLARFWDVPSMEFVPRGYFNPDRTLLAQLRALEVDDLVELTIRKLKVPSRTSAKGRKPERRYVMDGTLRLVNVRTGNVVAETTLEKVILPDIGAYDDDVDAQAATFMALASHMLSYYEAQSAAVKFTPTTAALDAAEDAEQAGRHEDAALILSEIVRRDPSKEAALRDRRDLAIMRSGRSPGSAATPSAVAAPEMGGATPRSGVDYLAPENRGRLFPVSQGHVPVRQNLQAQSFAFSVGVLMKDSSARGGILVGSKTKNIYIALAPSEGAKSPPRLVVDTVNTVTGVSESYEKKLSPDALAVNRLVRLEARYDGGDLQIALDGSEVTTIPRVLLTQSSLFLFGKLSTVYFQDARLNY